MPHHVLTDDELAGLILAVRRGGPAIRTGPVPQDEAQAYRVQRLVMAELGGIGGWKVGAPGPDSPISCAPMPVSGLFEGDTVFDTTALTQREVESEFCVRLTYDLPPRQAPYSVAEIMPACGSCHVGIEILQSRFADPTNAGSLAVLADFIQHGAYVLGPSLTPASANGRGLQRLLEAPPAVTQTIGDANIMHSAANPAGDMLRLLRWLADSGAVWAGGLRAGQVVTLGSWTGKTYVPPGSIVTARFAGSAPLTIRFRP